MENEIPQSTIEPEDLDYPSGEFFKLDSFLNFNLQKILWRFFLENFKI